MNAKLDKFGRIIIPKGLRTAEGWEEGTQFQLEMGKDGLVIKPQLSGASFQDKDGVLVFTGQIDPKFRDVDFVKLGRENRIQDLINL